MSYEIEEIKCSSPPDEEKEQFNLFRQKNILDNFILKQLSIICFTSSILLTVIICAVTFCRYVLKSDLFGYEEVVKLIAFWLYFMGAAAGAYNRTHVSADLVNAYLEDGRLKSSLIIIRNFVTVAVCLLFTGYCYHFFVFGYVGPVGLAQGKAMESVEWMKLAAFGLYFATIISFANYAAQFTFQALKPEKREKEKKEAAGHPLLNLLQKGLISIAPYAGALTIFSITIFIAGLFFKDVLLDFIGAPATGIAIRRTALWRIGLWTGYLSVFIGFILMTFYFLRDLFLSCAAADAQEFDIIRIKEVSLEKKGGEQ